jgi:hypothetical protein
MVHGLALESDFLGQPCRLQDGERGTINGCLESYSFDHSGGWFHSFFRLRFVDEQRAIKFFVKSDIYALDHLRSEQLH